MKNQLLTCLLACLFGIHANAQDTLKVQTFTWADNHRVDTFDFPDNPGQTYRKILMIYNMRCHGAAVGSGSGGPGCWEWDYSCNTFITDPTRTDSTRTESPNYVISNFSGASFPYSLTPTYNYVRFTQHQAQLVPGSNASEAVFTGPGPDAALAPNAKTFRYQAILPAAALLGGGLATGPVYGLRLGLEQAGGTVGFFKIRLKNTTQSMVGDLPDETGLLEVYHRNTDFSAGGDVLFPFYQPFAWTGVNVLLDISFTTPEASDAPVFRFFEAPVSTVGLVSSPGSPENTLLFDGACAMDVPASAFQSVQNEITLSFWVFGNAAALPAATHLLEGKDAGGNRQATVHLPWSNGEVFWDCGNDGTGYDRINKAASPADFEGQWNHWAFTKNAATGEMKIFLNGQLWHSATGKTKPIDIRSFRIGKSLTSQNPYFGLLDEVQVWDKALDAATIQNWMSKKVDNTHPFYDRLTAYYPLNEGSGTVASDASANANHAAVLLPHWEQVRGSRRFHNFSKTDLWPRAVWLQGDYTIADLTVAVLDSAASPLHQVVQYGVAGTTLTPVDTQFVYPAGQRPVFDESGVQVDSIAAPADGTIQIEPLVHYTKREARFELLSLVTPYGNGLDLGQNGKTFTFDVTDFAPVLKGKRRMSIEFGGEFQEELDIQFWYITGTPERPVLDIQPIWPQARGGFAEIQSDRRFEPRQVPLRADAAHFKIRSAITGHEQNGEFEPREHYININGGPQEFTYNVWKACSFNPIYPQGGTWIFDRAGWCPGMATDVHSFSLDGIAQPGQSVEIDYGVNGPDMTAANYLVNNLLVSYGSYTAQVDASLEAIVRPNLNQVEYARLNPACNTPMVRVKNSGAQPIQAITLEYYVSPGDVRTHTWTGNLAPQATVDVTLPSPAVDYWQAGNTFTARITGVNGAPDGNADNDRAQSAYAPPKEFTFAQTVQLRVRTNATGDDYAYRVKDGSGALLIERDNLAANTTYNDDLAFPPGCYSLEFDDAGQDGLSFWFFPNNGNGALTFQRLLPNGSSITVHSLNPDFGAGVRFDFVLNPPTDAPGIPDKLQLFSAYPNPARDVLNIDLMGFEGTVLSLRLVDLLGRTMQEHTHACVSENETARLDVGALAPGMYLLEGTDGKRNWVRQVVLE